MFRKDLIGLLLDHPRGLHEIAQTLALRPRDVEDDLTHLLKSLKHSEYRAVIEPAHCGQCGFTFHKDKLHKPGKCPRCRGTRISEPRISLEAR